jgi:hypothetical protein
MQITYRSGRKNIAWKVHAWVKSRLCR